MAMMRSRLLPRTQQQCHHFSTSCTFSQASGPDFTHTVIGAGAVGLAIARRLSQVPNTQTLLLERNRSFGTETSSRNSEVIHAGLYYGHDSLKTQLCLQGKRMMYELCGQHNIPHRNCGKWIVAQDDAQMAALEKVHAFASDIGVPTRFLSRQEAASREPDVRAEAGVLESESTGIVDSHAYMQFLEGEFTERYGGTVAYNSPVTSIEARGNHGSGGWTVHTGSDEDGTGSAITTTMLINSAGLGACNINNLLYPDPSHPSHREAFYAKGSYYSYSASHPAPHTLIYPAPIAGHGGLGTHLTLDMAGRVRFGPDVEWVNDPTDLAPNADTERFEAALADIATYLPGLDRTAVARDYSGIRPKLSQNHSAVSGEGFMDFVIRREEGWEGFVNLLGIESPGLTSSLAIGEFVHGLLYR